MIQMNPNQKFQLMGMAEDRTMARFYSMTMKSDPYALNFQSIDGISSPNNGKFLLPVMKSITCLSPSMS